LPPGTAFPPSAGAVQWVPSPDGRNLAMVVQESQKTALWVRPLSAAAAHRLDRTEGANFPFWSPDGQFIAFVADDKLKRIAVAGGAVQTICDALSRASGGGGAWSKDGVVVFGTSGGPLMRVPAQGGIPTPATSLQKDERAHAWPQFLPDGRRVLYMAR